MALLSAIAAENCTYWHGCELGSTKDVFERFNETDILIGMLNIQKNTTPTLSTYMRGKTRVFVFGGHDDSMPINEWSETYRGSILMWTSDRAYKFTRENTAAFLEKTKTETQPALIISGRHDALPRRVQLAPDTAVFKEAVAALHGITNTSMLECTQIYCRVTGQPYLVFGRSVGRPGEDTNYWTPGEDTNCWMPTMYGPIIATGGTLKYDGAVVVYEFRDASPDAIDTCMKWVAA